jgi:hypothetical protein
MIRTARPSQEMQGPMESVRLGALATEGPRQ